ncbi:MAG: hypothetical protein IKS16_09205, partial [Lachnospiraceae bacterium]|nr:hypothetical protein [Lachnospiraceae bacterium]
MINDKNVTPVVYGILTPNEYTVHWMSSETEEFTTTKVKFGYNVYAPESGPLKSGYYQDGWKTEDETVYYAAETGNYAIMPANDLYLYPVYKPLKTTAYWSVDGGEEIEHSITVGELLYNEAPSQFDREGYQLIWYSDVGYRTGSNEWTFNSENRIPFDYQVPYVSGMHFYGRYSRGFATIGWVNGNDIIATDVEVGTVPVKPVLTPSDPDDDQTDLGWMLEDGSFMGDDFVMPDHNVIVTAFWHKHQWAQEAVTQEATCVSEGKAGFRCELCGAIKADEILPIDPDNHGDDLLKVGTKYATCSEEGWEQYVCLHCGKEIIETLPIDPGNHTPSSEIVGYVNGDCGHDGYSGDIYCKDCGELIEKGHVIPATGKHSSGYYVVSRKQSTCSEHGYEERMCFICNETYKVETPLEPDNHTWSTDYEVIVAPTCGSAGEGRYICTGCGAVKTDIIPATGNHSWDRANGEIIKINSCREHGIIRVACGVCGQTHDFDNGWDPDCHLNLGEPEILEAPTYYTVGRQRRLCNDCGTYVFETIPKLEAEWGEITYTWSANNTSVTATRPCLSDRTQDYTETVGVDISETGVTCTTGGTTTYTTQPFMSNLFTQQTKTVQNDALGHAWGNITYTWSEEDGNKYVTATRACARDASHTETEKVLAVRTEENGVETYTATFENADFETQILNGHVHQYTVLVAEESFDPEPEFNDQTGDCIGWKKGQKTYTCATDPSHPKKVEEIKVPVKM